MLISTSVAQTQKIGAALSQQLEPNDVLILLGDMGAGKSELTRGLARGLGVTGYVTSPTFTIMQLHDSGRLPLYHFDWYRLESAEELYELSMDEYLQNGGVAVIEWPSRAEEAVPETHLEITAAAIRAGKAVMCDKPAVPTLAEAEELYKVVTSAPCAFQMGLNLPCRPALIKTKELIDSGAIGKVFSVRGCCDVGYAFAHDVILRKFAGDPAGFFFRT